MNDQSSDHSKLKVFVSYSRDDIAFADEIVAGLEYDGGFEISMDRHSVHEGEDWKARLGALIAEADTIVFILSPNSIKSPICQWETNEAERLSKRILPILAEQIGDTPVPKQLAAIHYVRFDEDKSFMSGLIDLRRALNTDIDWLREHTRLFNRAFEWETAGRPENRLLSGSDIVDSKKWLELQPKEAPAPTELHRSFIKESDRSEVARLSVERKRAEILQRAVTRTRVALVLVTLLGLIAIGIGYYAYQKFLEADELRAQLTELSRLAKAKKLPVPAVKSGVARFISKGTFQALDDGSKVRVLTEVVFQDAKGIIWKVPPDKVFDGSSMPKALLSVIGAPLGNNNYSAFALLDYYSLTKEYSSKETHRMLYEALIASGVAEQQAKLMYAAVYRFGPRWGPTK